MNLYEVKTSEQYGSVVPINADYYIVRDRTLDFYVFLEDNSTELIASFWNHEWKYVEKVVDVDE